MSEEKRETELEKAIREADEAEAKLRRMKESLMPRDRAQALEKLMVAEMSAMTRRVTGLFADRITAARTDEESRAVLADMRDALLEGADRVHAAMRQQLQAWTVAGIEDREAEGL